MHCDALIIGGGSYGLRLAEWAAGRCPSVVLAERRSELFFMFSLIGAYLSRVLEETSDRPLRHVRYELSSAVVLSDPARRNVLDRTEDERAQPASPEV